MKVNLNYLLDDSYEPLSGEDNEGVLELYGMPLGNDVLHHT
jgi:hypothetical protein